MSQHAGWALGAVTGLESGGDSEGKVDWTSRRKYTHGKTQRVPTKARTDGRTTEPERTILTRCQRCRVTGTCDHVRLTTELLPGLQNGKRKGGC